MRRLGFLGSLCCLVPALMVGCARAAKPDPPRPEVDLLASLFPELSAAPRMQKPRKRRRVVVGEFPCAVPGMEGMTQVSRSIEAYLSSLVSRQAMLELVPRRDLARFVAERKVPGLDILAAGTPLKGITEDVFACVLRGSYTVDGPIVTFRVECAGVDGGKATSHTRQIDLHSLPGFVTTRGGTRALEVVPRNVPQSRRTREFAGKVVSLMPNRDILLELWTDDGRRDYKEGETFVFWVRADKPCDIAAFCHQIDGESVLLFPNDKNDATDLLRGESVAIPGVGKDGFVIEVVDPFGADVVQVFACTDRDELNALIRKAISIPDSPFAQLNRGDLESHLRTRSVHSEEKTKPRKGAGHVPQWGEAHMPINTYSR